LPDLQWNRNAKTNTFPRYCGKAAGSNQKTGSTDAVLQNATMYAVAVAGYDKLGNVGKLSDPTCGTPIPIDDFWDLYRRAGGDGGGCSCSLARTAGWPISAGFTAGGMLGAAALLLRRRSRRARPPKTLSTERA